MSIYEGDCLELLAGQPDTTVDAVMTDPPYGLHILGQEWDKVLPPRETWEECLRVLRPGGYLAAMGAARVYHRLAVAIEDAGFEIRDSLSWLYGSGFPKSSNGDWGGSALKPAWEPIVLARKPLDGTHKETFERWGTGGLNIDAARVPLNGEQVETNIGFTDEPQAEGWGTKRPVTTKRGGDDFTRDRQQGTLPHPNGWGEKPWKRNPEAVTKEGFLKGLGGDEGSPLGRWPANVVHDGSPEVVSEFPHTATGIIEPHHHLHGGEKSIFGIAPVCGGIGDAGSAARFFYAAKPSRAEKEGGLAGKPVGLLPRAAGGIDRFAPTERRCTHPTVKPVELFRWLVRLLSRPGQRVLDPFLGSGTTAIACILEGREWLGAERSPEYAAIARARIAEWTRLLSAHGPGLTVAEYLGESRDERAVSAHRRALEAAGQGMLL